MEYSIIGHLHIMLALIAIMLTLIIGRWLEKDGERRKRYYRLTPEGRKVLAAQRDTWREFVAAINRVTRARHA